MALHKKLFFAVMLPLLIALGINAWYNIRLNREQIIANHRDKVELLTEVVSNGLMTLMCEGKGKEFQKFLEALVAEDISAVRIFSQNGTILNSSVPGEVGGSISKQEIERYINGSNPSMYAKKLEGGGQAYSKIFFIKNSLMCQKCHGAGETIRGILYVEISTSEEDRQISGVARNITIFSVVAAAVLSVLASLAGRFLVGKPLAALIDSLKKSGGKEPIESSLYGRDDEIGSLASGLNEIISDLNRTKSEIDRCNTANLVHMEKMATIGELAASVAHEIKNPLAGISGALQVLAEDFPEDSPRKEIANEILTEIDRLDNSIKELIIYARPPQLNLIPTDINAIIEKIGNSLKTTASEFNVDIRLITEKMPEIMVDPGQMEQALLTIANHCLQSMREGGILTAKTRTGPGTGEVEITLSSTGEGMAEEDVREIFKPMFSRKHSGTGLGLAISRNIIEGHRGRIEVESHYEAGTAFRIILNKG